MAIGETFKREVEVRIPKNKRSENLESLSTILGDLEQAEQEKAEAMKDHNSKLKDLRDAARKTNHAIQTGKHLVEVECEERLAGKNVEVVRTDTGEVVEKRAATAAELQIDAFVDGLAGESVAGRRAKAKAKPKRGRKPKGDAGATP